MKWRKWQAQAEGYWTILLLSMWPLDSSVRKYRRNSFHGSKWLRTTKMGNSVSGNRILKQLHDGNTVELQEAMQMEVGFLESLPIISHVYRQLLPNNQCKRGTTVPPTVETPQLHCFAPSRIIKGSLSSNDLKFWCIIFPINWRNPQ